MIGIRGRHLLLLVVIILVILATAAFAQEDAFTRADAAFSRRDWAVARQEYERIVETYPGTATAWLRLAQIHEELGNWNDVVAIYEKLVTLGPVNRDTRMAYGDALRNVGRLEDALAQYELAVREAPVTESVDKALSRACDAFDRGDLEAAQQSYEDVTRNWPGHPTAWLGLARIHSRNAEMAISRPMMIIAVTAINGVGMACTSKTSAAATISLSATGSRNAPKAEVWPSRRAR